MFGGPNQDLTLTLTFERRAHAPTLQPAAGEGLEVGTAMEVRVRVGARVRDRVTVTVRVTVRVRVRVKVKG